MRPLAFRHEAQAGRELRARKVNGATGRVGKQCKRSAKDAAFVPYKNEDVKYASTSSGVGAWGRSLLTCFKSADPGGARGVWVSFGFEQFDRVYSSIEGRGLVG